MLPELYILKDSIVDVRCIDTHGRQFIVEMQMYWTEAFQKRVLLNASKAYVMQLNIAEDFSLLQPVYSLNFVDDNFEKSPDMKDEYYHHYKIVNINHTEKQIKGLEFVFIELKKFKPTNRAERKLQDLWLRFLTEINEHTEEVPHELIENKDIKEALHFTECAGYNKAQLLYYDAYRDKVMKERTALTEALREGRAEGLAESREQTIIIGHQQGLTIPMLGKITSLPEEQVSTILIKHGLLQTAPSQ